MRVLLDCDGVLAGFTEKYLKTLEELTGACILEPSDVDCWKIEDWGVFKKIQAAHPDIKKRMFAEMIKPGYCSDFPVLPGARKAVRELQSFAEVVCVTAPWDSSPTWYYDRLRWLANFGIPKSHVIVTASKHMVAGDIFVDDKPSNVRAWRDAWPGRKAMLFATPQNHWHGSEDVSDLVRVNWEHVIWAAK